eukprot:TRINITY_DN4301_c1_g2_i9.p1 TRINITY_DN4301_c1_g2~~TRINITY_DN4301_c1_g2_i9.p1  ORF type:complete len:422 (-),score=37.88 TRINITY_DN4301_c1_g2_i9:663-1928(-)
MQGISIPNTLTNTPFESEHVCHLCVTFTLVHTRLLCSTTQLLCIKLGLLGKMRSESAEKALKVVKVATIFTFLMFIMFLIKTNYATKKSYYNEPISICMDGMKCSKRVMNLSFEGREVCRFQRSLDVDNSVVPIHAIIAAANRTEFVKDLLQSVISIGNPEDVIWKVVEFTPDANSELKQHIEYLSNKYPSNTYQYFQLNQKFGRAIGFQHGLKTIPEGEIAFVVDADMRFKSLSIFNEIRHSVVQGKQAVNFVANYYYTPQDRAWLAGGYGLIAIYPEDLHRVGGYANGIFGSKTSWGGEDIDFIRRLKHSGMSLCRVKNEDFVHVYHPKPTSAKWYGNKNKKGTYLTQWFPFLKEPNWSTFMYGYRHITAVVAELLVRIIFIGVIFSLIMFGFRFFRPFSEPAAITRMRSKTEVIRHSI